MAGEGRLITRSMRSARLGGLAAAALLAATTVLLTGCLVVQRAPDGSLSLTTGTPEQIADREQAKADKSAEVKDATLHPDESTPAEVGTQFTTGSWQVTVTSVRPHSKMSDGREAAQGQSAHLRERQGEERGRGHRPHRVAPAVLAHRRRRTSASSRSRPILRPSTLSRSVPSRSGWALTPPSSTRSQRVGGLRLPLPEAQDLAH